MNRVAMFGYRYGGRLPGKSRLAILWHLRAYITGLVTENLAQTTALPPFKKTLVTLACR